MSKNNFQKGEMVICKSQKKGIEIDDIFANPIFEKLVGSKSNVDAIYLIISLINE